MSTLRFISSDIAEEKEVNHGQHLCLLECIKHECNLDSPLQAAELMSRWSVFLSNPPASCVFWCYIFMHVFSDTQIMLSWVKALPSSSRDWWSWSPPPISSVSHRACLFPSWFWKILLESIRTCNFSSWKSVMVRLQCIWNAVPYFISYVYPGGWEIAEGAFGPPPPNAKRQLFSFYDEQKKLVVLLHRDVRWDLLVPIQGQERAFQWV